MKNGNLPRNGSIPTINAGNLNETWFSALQETNTAPEKKLFNLTQQSHKGVIT